MDKLTACETDRGRYAVRPMNWAGIWNEKRQIQESLHHLELFIEKEYAEKFAEQWGIRYMSYRARQTRRSRNRIERIMNIKATINKLQKH